jgi:hypothetical protein
MGGFVSPPSTVSLVAASALPAHTHLQLAAGWFIFCADGYKVSSSIRSNTTQDYVSYSFI